MVKSEKIYSPQSYIGAVTGKHYSFTRHEWPVDSILEVLTLEGYDNLWDYPLTEIDHIVENGHDVVLVNCSFYEENEHIEEYRWFEVPEDFKE